MPIKKFITLLAKITLYIKMAFKLLARLDTQSPNILTPLSITGFKVLLKEVTSRIDISLKRGQEGLDRRNHLWNKNGEKYKQHDNSDK